MQHLSDQLLEYTNWIRVHQIGMEYTLKNVADEHGIDSPQFRLECLKYDKEVHRQQSQLEVLEWALDLTLDMLNQMGDDDET